MIVPALAWSLTCFLGPLFLVIVASFLTRSTGGGIEFKWTIANYLRVADWLYLKIMLRSLGLAALTSVLCLLLSIPVTWFLLSRSERRRPIYLFALTLPFFTNLLARIYAIKLTLSYDGPIANALRWMDPSFDAFRLTQNLPAVLFGMVGTYLPFMLWPIFVAFERIDKSLLEAAHDLGATHWTSFYKILLPLLKPAIFAGIVMVFVPVLGEYVIPDLLGGARVMLVGNLVTEQFLKVRDWPFGSALACVLLLSLLLTAWRRSHEGT